jgi:hypothetical protein
METKQVTELDFSKGDRIDKIHFQLLREKGYEFEDPFDVVDIFEKKVAEYAGSKYAVAVDNGTDALFLCLTYLKKFDKVTIPKNTYVSVPSTLIQTGHKVEFQDIEWSGIYQLKPYPIYDSCCRFQRGMYVQDSYQCLSFHYKKILKMIKGGMILTNDEDAYNWFRVARAKGRHPHDKVFYKDEHFDMLGWNMYLPPEHCAEGILIFDTMSDYNEDCGSSDTYHSLDKYEVFK